jgi:hypothetical protein
MGKHSTVRATNSRSTWGRRIVAVMAVGAMTVAIAPALAGPADAKSTKPSHRLTKPDGKKAQIAFDKKTESAWRKAVQASGPTGLDTTSMVTYHGGPVMRDPVNYLIFWQPTGQSFPAGYMQGIRRFFEDIGGTPHYNIITQYGDSTATPVPNHTTYGGTWTNTNAFPHAGTGADPLTDGDIQTAVDDAISANTTWQAPGLSTMYFVFLPKGIDQCMNSSSCFTIDPTNGKYCAYHSYFGGNKIYASMPFNGGESGCTTSSPYPNGENVDEELRVTTHEMFEAHNDPYLNAWYDSTGDENSDKCNFNFGYKAPTGTNLVLHSNPYQIQLEWSNDAVTGCVKRYGSDGEVSVSGSLDFGTVARGTTASRQVIVTNTGAGDLNIDDLRLGTADSRWSITSPTSRTATLPPGGSLPVTVVFAPPSSAVTVGPAANTLVIDDDSPPVNAVGGGTADHQTVVAATALVGVPKLAISPGSINFGMVCRGTIADRDLTATDTGTAPLTIGSVAMGGGSSPSLSVLPIPSLPQTIAVGAGLGFTIRLAPPANAIAGPVAGSAVVVSSDDPSSPASVGVIGSVGAPQLTVGAGALDFGGVAVDDRTSPNSRVRTVTISNTGDCPLVITSALSISGPNAGDFSVVGPTGSLTIAGGSSLTVSIRFNPSAAGVRNASLDVSTDDPVTPTASIPLTGLGLLPGIDASPASLSFAPTVLPSQVPGYPGSVLTDTFTNTGQAELIVDSITTTPGSFTAPGAATPPNRYAPSDHFSVPVTFGPVAVGKVTGSLTVSDTVGVSRVVPLCGEGVRRGIRVLAVNAAGTPYASVSKLKLQSHGTSVGVNINTSTLLKVPVTTSCQAGQERHYENQNLPSAGTPNQRSSYYTLAVSVGGKSTTITFTLGVSEFKEITIVVK